MPRPTSRTLLMLAFLLLPSRAIPADLEKDPTLYMVAVSHLDTQWWWTIEKTINDYLPATFEDTFDQLDAFPGYTFSWEGAHRYMLLSEYHPQLAARLSSYVDAGRWRPAGSALEGGDVNVPSPESLVRQFLYGNGWFWQELGVRSEDVFLPDCFGFGWALPSVAAHCRLRGFSTQKLDWGTPGGAPFPLGVWEGPDRGSVVAALDPGAYVSTLEGDLAASQDIQAAVETQEQLSGLQVAYRYFGTGDQGGAVPWESLEVLMEAADAGGPLRVLSAASDQLFRDLTPAQVEALPRHAGELLLTTHGTGAYSSQAAMKRWNRKNELLGDAAERAAAAAAWLAGLPYPEAELRDAWMRFLVHQFHDDLTGTGIPEIYTYSWNSELLALKRFAGILTRSVAGVSRALDSATEGLPLVVFNPLSIPREDVVEARIRFPGAAPASLRVLGPDGQEVPSQVLSADEEAAEILFLAELPAVGFSVHEVRSGAPREVADTGLQVGQDFLESPRYRVELDTAGDVARILDRAQGRELLTAPLRLALFDDLSPVWPAWEIMFPDLLAGPRGHVEGPAEVTVVEEGPVRVALEVRRTLGDTVIRQVVRLSAGAAGDRVELDLSLRWRTLGTLLKLELPLEAEAPVATYDLGLGVIQRGVNTPELYEVPAQQWADLGAGDGSHGVLVTTDCKYGWDRPEPGLLRLTLLHTPALSLRSGYYNQFLNDVGDHRVLVALAGHEGSWRDGAPWVAARLNQPPLAFQVPRRQGSERTFSFLSVDHPGVAARALKQAEDGDGFILRLQELRGEPAAGVRISFPAGLDSAREVWGSEEDRGPATLDGGALVLDMAPFALRSFRVRPRGPEAQPDPLPGSLPLALPFDTDVVSPDDARADGAMGPVAGVPRAWPAALFPAEVLDGGVRFVLGPTGPGEDNAVTCQGQEIPLAPREGDALHLLVAAVGDREATFRVGDLEHHAALVDWTGWVGQWDSRVPDLDQDPVLDIAAMAPAFVKAGEIGLYATHRHRPDGDDPFVFCYLQRLVIPLPEGATALVLPKDDAVRVLAATLAPSGLAQAAAVSPLHDLFDADAQGRPWEEDGPPPDPSPEGAPDAGGPQDGQEPGADPDGRSRDRGCTAGSPAAASPGILLAAAALLGALRRKTVLRPAAG